MYSDDEIQRFLDLSEEEVAALLEDKPQHERDVILLAMNVARGLREESHQSHTGYEHHVYAQYFHPCIMCMPSTFTHASCVCPVPSPMHHVYAQYLHP